MFERNFTKSDKSDKAVQEALVVKASSKNQSNKVSNYKKKSRKDDVCNYCKKSGHWIKGCKQWIGDGKSLKKTARKAMQLQVWHLHLFVQKSVLQKRIL